LGTACTCDEVGQVHLTAYWQVEESVEANLTVFAHLLDSEDVLIAQADGYPLLGMLPFWLFEPGEVMRDVRHFDTVASGEYTVRLGVWDPSTGERLPVETADGSSWPDRALLIGPCAQEHTEDTR
jgi:hypothetical protein